MSEKGETIEVTAVCGLYAGMGTRLCDDLDRKVKYTFTESGVTIRAENCEGTKYVLPLICGEPEITCGKLERSEPIFYLTGGFEAKEFTLIPIDGAIEFIIS